MPAADPDAAAMIAAPLLRLKEEDLHRPVMQDPFPDTITGRALSELSELQHVEARGGRRGRGAELLELRGKGEGRRGRRALTSLCHGPRGEGEAARGGGGGADSQSRSFCVRVRRRGRKCEHVRCCGASGSAAPGGWRAGGKWKV
jgi:hypothetical protein